MIDEAKEEQAALYALGLLSHEDAAQFLVELDRDPALQELVNDLEATAAALLHALPVTKAPPELLPRILAKIQGERPLPAKAPAPSHRINYVPWTIAAACAVTAAVLYLRVAQWRESTLELRQQQDALLAEKTLLEAEQRQLGSKLEDLDNERKRLVKERENLEKIVSDLRSEDNLSKMRIAMLKSQVAAYAKVVAVAVWDAEKQRGIFALDNVPQAAAGKDYQLWVIDPKYPAPVSGGVIPVAAGGVSRVNFKPEQPIASAEKFAVSVEPKGGSRTAQGPIVLISN